MKIIKNINFENWIKDSKLLSKNGEAIVVYHGTIADIETFDPEKSGSKSKTGAPKGSFFFSDKPDVASSYTVKWQGDFSSEIHEGANVMPVYLSIKKPLTINAKGDSWRYIAYKGEFFDINEIVQMAKNSGKYDGVIIKNVTDKGVGNVVSKTSTTYVTFSPEQIKSAIGNSGNFDPKSIFIADQEKNKKQNILITSFGLTVEETNLIMKENLLKNNPNFVRITDELVL